MNNKNRANIIDWTDRKEVMATYREYERWNMTGLNYRYWNGKLLPVDKPMMTGRDPVPYRVESEKNENQE